MKADEILSQGVDTIAQRGKAYDSGEERSMGKVVSMFATLTGHHLTEVQAFQFMEVLKMVRSSQGEYNADNFLDGACYAALAGEAAELEQQ